MGHPVVKGYMILCIRDGRRVGPGGVASTELEQLGVLAVAGNYDNGVLNGLARKKQIIEFD